MTGELVIFVRSAKTCRRIRDQCFVYKNVVTDAMKGQMTHLLAGDIYGSGSNTRNVDRMQFGTGTMAETAVDTELQSPITPVKDILAAGISYPPPYTVQFEAFLLAGEANGFPISEAGLLCEDDTLGARKVFGAFDKTSDYILEFRWRISCN